MTLKITNDNRQGNKYGIGIFISKVQIVNAVNRSGERPEFLRNTPDIFIELKLDVGKDFQPTMSFFGDFKRDPRSGEILDWGSAFKIRNLFSAFGIEGEVAENGTISDGLVNRLFGKEFYRLQYVSGEKYDGKLKYSDWTDQIEIENPDNLARAFFRSVEKGFPKNYKPELLNGNLDSNGYSTSVIGSNTMDTIKIHESDEL
jgi:hypothetical protein